MSRETQKKCRYSDCDTSVNDGGVETNLGWFCSNECREFVVTRIFNVLAFPDWMQQEEKKPNA